MDEPDAIRLARKALFDAGGLILIPGKMIAASDDPLLHARAEAYNRLADLHAQLMHQTPPKASRADLMSRARSLGLARDPIAQSGWAAVDR